MKERGRVKGIEMSSWTMTSNLQNTVKTFYTYINEMHAVIRKREKKNGKTKFRPKK